MEYIEYWNQRYSSGGNSGHGSYDEQLTKKLKWLSGLPIKSIVEVGCGDFNFGSNLLKLYPKVDYQGTDISDVVIKHNKIKFPEINFGMVGHCKPADLVMCIDVLFHTLKDEDYENTLDRIENLWTDYLAVTSYEYDKDLGNHVNIRKFPVERFGVPIIREVVEEDGQLYFYLFKKQTIDLRKVSCCLITGFQKYPEQILENIEKYPFGEILIMTNCKSPYEKYQLINKARYDTVYYQDDDAIVPIDELLRQSKIDEINVGMKQSHFDSYKDKRMTMGLGWGSFFKKSVLKELKKYSNVYGEDYLFKRDTEKLLTHLHFPQNRIVLPIIDLPWAMDSNRVSLDINHYHYMEVIEEKCKDLI